MSPAATPVAAGAAPTRSEIEAWPTQHLEEAAGRWRKAATSSTDAFEQHRQNISSPGGTLWEGDAKDAALHRVTGDLAVATRQAAVKGEAADIAESGAGDIRAVKARVLEAITEAEQDGFRVGEDLSVKDTRPVDLSNAQARYAAASTHAEFIAFRAAQLVQTDALIGQQLHAKAAELEGIRFDGEGDHGADGDHVQLVDHHFKLGPNGTDDLSPNRRKAVQFAEENAKGYGNILERKWFNEQENDCTNFVSNALNAGGFEDDDPFHTNTRTEDRWFPYSMKGSPSAAWDRADGLYHYIKNGYGKGSGGPVGTEIGSVTLDPTKGTVDPNYLTKIGMKPGDIIVYDWNGGEGISHSSMYVGQQSLSDIPNASGDAVDYHSNNTAHHSWALAATDRDGHPIPRQVTYRFIHVQYPGEQQ